jgi:hypothetical protein
VCGMPLDTRDFGLQSETMDSVEQSKFRAPAGRSEAAAEMREVTAAARKGQQLAGAVWFPLLLWGIAEIASPTVVRVIERTWSGTGSDAAALWYWASVSVVIVVTCLVFYARRPVQVPRPNGFGSVGTTLVMVPVAIAIGVVGGIAGGPEMVVALGLGAFALMYRSSLIAIVACAHLVAGIAIAVSGSDTLADAMVIAVGTVSCVCALAAVRTLERSMWSPR